MKTKIIAFLLICCFAGVSNAQKIRILSYNIRFGELADMETLAKVISQCKPDIVALQELDAYTDRPGPFKSSRSNYISELGGYTRMHSAYGRTIWYKGGEYGIGILSQNSFDQTEKYTFTAKGVEARAALKATITLKNGQRFGFISTHLDHNNPAIRKQQVMEILENLTSSDIPQILAGDLNESPDDTNGCIPLLETKWKMACKNDEYTVPAKKPNRKIDYIMVYPANRWKVVKSKVIDEPAASDHRPILTVVKLRGK